MGDEPAGLPRTVEAEVDFDADPQSVREVRRFVEGVLPGVSHLDDIVLAASELATNVVRHAHTAFTVRITSVPDRVRIEVSNGSSIVPAVVELTSSGRGLRVIERVSDRWGVELVDTGKTVWVEFDR